MKKMLVLTRKAGEEILIGDDITLVVTRISGNRVTLGVKAPREHKIVRGELRLYEGEPDLKLVDGDSENAAEAGSSKTPLPKLRIAR